MFAKHSPPLFWLSRLLTLQVLAIGMTLTAAPPTWWSLPDATNHTVIDPSASDANAKGPANIGQAKFIAKRALDALNTVDPSLATQVRDRLSRNQLKPSSENEFLPAIVDLELPGSPLPDDWHERQHAPLLIGQLKALATPFYDVLHQAAPLWLDNEAPAPSRQGQLQLNATKDHSDPSNYYPWSSDPGDDYNQALATIGQLKAVFSLRLETLIAILDSDQDGLTNAEEALHHTDPLNPDTDGDGMPDAWEIKWGLDPLNPADAMADADGDSLSNLAEYQAGTCPTGIYRVDVLPLGANQFFHSAADDGSVVMQATPVWDPASALEFISPANAAGARSVTPMLPANWNPLETIVAELVADGLLDDGDFLTPFELASSDGNYRVFQSTAKLWILHQPGSPVSNLPEDIPWQIISNNGQAVAMTQRHVATAGDIQEHIESDLWIAHGHSAPPSMTSMPAVWFPAATQPTIQAFSDTGDVVVHRAITNPDGSSGNESYLLKLYQKDFTMVRQPGFPDESIIAISPHNTRMLGSGAKPFLITSDGTPILLEALHIATSSSAQAVALASIYPNPLIPHHISSDGSITLTTTDVNNQTTLLQIIPDNDSDHDGMMDDWEKSFAQGLLASGKSPEDWAPLYADLLAGNLNPTTDYTGEGVTAAVIANLFSSPAALQSPDCITLRSQSRRNNLVAGLYKPQSLNSYEIISGYYNYNIFNDYLPEFEVTSYDQLQPEYMAKRILTYPWKEDVAWPNLSYPWNTFPAILGWSRFYITKYPESTNKTGYNGEYVQYRYQLTAMKPSAVDRSCDYLRLTRRDPTNDQNDTFLEIVKIESKIAVIPAGKLTSEWIELIAQVEENYQNEVSFVQVRLAVDANRDGKITFDSADTTTEDKPFVFWVNDDHDVKHPMDLIGTYGPATLVQEDVCDGVKDCLSSKITCTRDLEDFTRLHLSIQGLYLLLLDDKYTVGLEFVQTTGNPSIAIFLAEESDGGMQYLLDNTVAEAQLADTKYNTTLGCVGQSYNFKFPQSTWDTLLSSNSTTHLIFEGCESGKGRLQFTIYKGEQKVGSCGSLWIELKSIKKMYQRWNANEVGKPGIQWDVWPSKSASQDADSTDPPTPQTDDEKDFVLFVHGWNMAMPEKRAFAETAYKRLWQLGYKGRFGAFFWPTFYESALNTGHFDGSEQRAWESSDALLDLLKTLNKTYPGRVNLLAHSMGNIVASEALHKASSILVKNYVASQAALPADVFKLNPDVTEKWPTILTETLTGYSIPLPALKKCTTPNIYAYYYDKGRTDLAYRKQEYPQMGKPYMTGIGGAANWRNYMNPADWALGLWIIDQSKKPNGASPLEQQYDYVQLWLDHTWGFKKTESGLFPDYNFLYLPDNRYEIFSYCAQARCYPAGRQTNVGGPFSDQKNFSDYGDKHPGHSAEFLESIGERWKYWNKFLIDCEIKHINNEN